MCTVSWLVAPDRYEVFANRDEKRTRGAALPPEVREGRGVRFLAPRDADFGGSWIATNEFGVTVTLLNRAAAPARPPIRSRGILVTVLAACRGVEEVSASLAAEAAGDFAAFTLAVFEPGRSPAVFEWTGSGAISRISRADSFLTSSSFDPAGVAEARSSVFRAAWRGGAAPGREDLLSLHRSHRPEPGPYSVCMHRDDAETVSFTHVSVGPGAVSQLYVSGAPCRSGPGTLTRLPVRASGEALRC